ncbi:MAG: TrkA family potassium uptake protein [Lachnospiraceae bacterium]|nr:TrkA family potassium uptake protein [Lachnospiraceae bacterium]MBR4780398.1 TrkA family potassium uptake protein [Lachnospiraceae bacterium]MBR6474785.1 TrkA family potassium uptake protein [Lachnospiraceae bacterium]
MKSVLVIGMGRFGKNATVKLRELGHEVMAVDILEERISDSLEIASNAIIGDTTSKAFLETLGVKDYDLCIVTIGDDFQSSLETTSLLKEMGAKKVISRASNDVQKKFLLRNGADYVVYPEEQVAHWVAIRYSSDSIFDYLSLEDGYSIVEINVPVKWTGRTIGELDVRKKHKINIIAIKHDDKMIMDITTNTQLSGMDRALVLGKDEDIQKCLKI